MKLLLEFHLITTIMPHCVYANTLQSIRKLQTFLVTSIFEK